MLLFNFYSEIWRTIGGKKKTSPTDNDTKRKRLGTIGAYIGIWGSPKKAQINPPEP